MTVSFLSLSYAIYNWRKTLAQLFSYMCTPHYGIMLSGILCTLVFPDYLECLSYGNLY